MFYRHVVRGRAYTSLCKTKLPYFSRIVDHMTMVGTIVAYKMTDKFVNNLVFEYIGGNDRHTIT